MWFCCSIYVIIFLMPPLFSYTSWKKLSVDKYMQCRVWNTAWNKQQFHMYRDQHPFGCSNLQEKSSGLSKEYKGDVKSAFTASLFSGCSLSINLTHVKAWREQRNATEVYGLWHSSQLGLRMWSPWEWCTLEGFLWSLILRFKKILCTIEWLVSGDICYS